MTKPYCFACGHEKEVILKIIVSENKPHKSYCIDCIVRRYGDNSAVMEGKVEET